MITPLIYIAKHSQGLYEWTVMVGQEAFENDVGERSVSSCLSCAVKGLPDDTRLVEVVYRGIHMGTFKKVALEYAVKDVAEKIASMHGALTNDY
ncbi:hypothetical protein [Pseudoduganella violaceinigra]|uniref:hypothetical protein n=1 Tax=Pseudoduganella violaceinigra TaxID=246602 RepID=UPI0004854A25|nr:hypothetical protein [Pseudoduganella violaceinigra]